MKISKKIATFKDEGEMEQEAFEAFRKSLQMQSVMI